MRTLVLILALASGAAGAFTVTAFLVSQTTSTSVTGQLINVCVYQYGGQRFERYFPMGTGCPSQVQVQ